MQTISQFLESRGYRRGMRHGRKAGREEGRSQALREALELVLVRRFGRLPASASARLEAADSEALRVWLEQAAVARSLRSVFATH